MGGRELSRIYQRKYANNPTTLSDGGNCNHVITASSIEGAIIDGFTIRDGSDGDQGGGIYSTYSYLTVRNCIIRDNSATYSGRGMYAYKGSLMLTNCVLTGNTSCAMYNNYAFLTGIINCTIAGNDVGIYNDHSPQFIGNSIIWRNTVNSNPNNIYNWNSTPVICISDMEGCGGSGANWDCDFGYDGKGNIQGDPLFVDYPLFNVYRLDDESPCIDYGIIYSFKRAKT